MVVTCDIQFENNPEGCYFAGQVMTGKIILSADKVKQVKAVVLKIKGYAHTSWSEKEMNDKSTTYSGHIDYINTVTHLLSSANPDESVIIEPGIHSFNFACHIPTNCPSSIEATRGHIRYLLKVILVRPWKFDQTFTKGFTVLKIVDLNYDTPLLKMPVNSDVSKVFCCGPFKSDPLRIQVRLPQSGYVPGQLIPVNVLVTNDTKTIVNEIRVRLVMAVCLYSQQPCVKAVNDHRTISKLLGDPVPVLCTKEFNYLLPVPATPPTCFNLCSIVQVGYRIEVEAKIDSIFYANQEIQIPVTIGNVPVMDIVQQQPPPMGARMLNGKADDASDAVDGNPLSGKCNTPPWSGNDSIPCPVFMEASFMPEAKLNADTQHDYGDDKFTPKYPVFNVPSTPIEKNENDYSTENSADTNKSTWL